MCTSIMSPASAASPALRGRSTSAVDMPCWGPYIPHISIASMKDFGRAKALCDELNEGQVRIEGRISALTPGVLSDGRFHPLRSYPLAPL